jgi:protease IV
MTDDIRERPLGEQLVAELLAERRRARRWGIFFKLFTLALATLTLVAVLGIVAAKEHVCLDRCTALIDVRGELASGGRASAERISAGLQAAFKHAGTKGVILRINSPGGSPVQAGQIYDEVRRLRKLHPGTPVAAVVEEVAASGGYYVAAAADDIYVDKASMIGSIGVIVDGFGFTGAMEKLGIERRVVTAGENKALFDPFEPVDPKQRAYIQRMVDEVHEQFIAAVRAGRGQRLVETTPGLFSGLVWNGKRAIDLGLADALGTVDGVARDVFKAEDVVDFTPEDYLIERVARRFGAALGGQFATMLRQSGWTLR